MNRDENNSPKMQQGEPEQGKRQNNMFGGSNSQSMISGGPGRGSPMGMAMGAEKPKNFKKSLFRILGYLKPFNRYFVLIIIMSALATLFTVAAPRVMSIAMNSMEVTMKNRIEGISSVMDYSLIVKVLIALVVLYSVSTVFSLIQQRLLIHVSQNVIRFMRGEIQQKLTKLPLSYFDKTPQGEILYRAFGDVDNIATTIQDNVTQFISGTITIIGVFIMMLIINPILTAVVLITSPFYFFVSKPIIKRSQKLYKKRQNTMGKLNGYIEEMYGGLKTVKAFGQEKQSIKVFKNIDNTYCEAAWRAQFITGTIMPIMSFLANLSYVTVCIVSGVLYVLGRILLGDISAFLIYVKQFSNPINQIASISNAIQSSIASAERIFELLDEKEESDVKTENTEFKDASVIFDNISFNYTPNKPLIENLSLKVNDGEVIAIVGPTGAGKTTLVNLLMRFYDIQKGEIKVGGVPISDCSRKDLREQFGMVLQDTWLFNGTIMENIRYGKADATDGECIEAAKQAQAHFFITTLPQGYQTILNEETSNISQGQKQLLTIARALLHNPKVLILDEATSYVDTLTEQLIGDGMNEIMKNRTSFVIAHRLSTIRNADNILVMNEGQIVEMGTHEQLIDTNDVYARLYQSQFNNKG